MKKLLSLVLALTFVVLPYRAKSCSAMFNNMSTGSYGNYWSSEYNSYAYPNINYLDDNTQKEFEVICIENDTKNSKKVKAEKARGFFRKCATALTGVVAVVLVTCGGAYLLNTEAGKNGNFGRNLRDLKCKAADYLKHVPSLNETMNKVYLVMDESSKMFKALPENIKANYYAFIGNDDTNCTITNNRTTSVNETSIS